MSTANTSGNRLNIPSSFRKAVRAGIEKAGVTPGNTENRKYLAVRDGLME
jgi:hypothetical protein